MAKSASSLGDCRYFFTFNGDGNIETERRWDPDAADASLSVQWFGDVTTPIEALVIGQNASAASSSRELAIFTDSSGDLRAYLGGSVNTFTSVAEWAGNKEWLFKFKESANLVELYMDDVLQASMSASFGAFRSPSVNTFLAGDPSATRFEIGKMANAKVWINAETTNNLILDMPINDNSNTIKDYSTLGLDGTLTPATGSWAEVCGLTATTNLTATTEMSDYG